MRFQKKKKKKKHLQKLKNNKMDPTVASSPLLEAILLPFIKQICFGAAQIHNLRTAISLQRKQRGGRSLLIKCCVYLKGASSSYIHQN